MASGDGLRDFARTVNHAFTTTPITVNLKYDVPVKVGSPACVPVCFAKYPSSTLSAMVWQKTHLRRL